MWARRSVLVLSGVVAATAAKSEQFQLPPEVTPALRAACETDVRRLCIGKDPTVAKVKSCVFRKYFQLGRKCQVELASLGFGR